MTNTSSVSKLRRFANTAIHQLDLYGQLACLEWKEEKIRLTGMLISLLLGFIFFFGLLISLSSMVIIFSWDTQYRNWAMVALVGFYALGVWFAWYSFRSLSKRGNQAFSATREELSTDIALLRNKMDS